MGYLTRSRCRESRRRTAWSRYAQPLSSDEFDRLLKRLRVDSGAPSGEHYAIRFDLMGECLALTVQGMILQNVPDEFPYQLEPLLRHRRAHNIIVDLSGVTYISSSIMGFLHHFLVVATTRSSQVTIVKPPEKVRKMMVLVGLYDYFVVLDSLEMACEYHKNLRREERGESVSPY